MTYVVSLSTKRCPEEYEPFSTNIAGMTVITNNGHTVDKGIEAAIVNEQLYAVFTAWDFFGQKVWWQDNEWWCEIWQHKVYQATVHAKTLENVMAIASAIYGRG